VLAEAIANPFLHNEKRPMKDIRKAWWTAALLAAFVGCNNEQPAGTEPAPPPPAGEPAVAPAPTGGTAGEAKPTEELPPAKPEEPNPEPKKDEGLKLNPPAVTPPAPPEKAEGEPKKEASNSTFTPDELAEINKLPASEREIALKQVNCPVGGDHLGAMGVPFKVTAEGKTFFLCCDGCKDEVKAHPKEVVAKLNSSK
jgi:YHS domain-containing protein